MLFKYCLHQIFQVVIIGALSWQSSNSLNSVQFKIPLLYNDEIPVTNPLKKDLLHLCPMNAIDPQYHNFYNHLKCTEDTGNTALDDIEENDSDHGRSDDERKTRSRSEIWSVLTIKTPEHCHKDIVLMSLMLTLNKFCTLI